MMMLMSVVIVGVRESLLLMMIALIIAVDIVHAIPPNPHSTANVRQIRVITENQIIQRRPYLLSDDSSPHSPASSHLSSSSSRQSTPQHSNDNARRQSNVFSPGSSSSLALTDSPMASGIAATEDKEDNVEDDDSASPQQQEECPICLEEIETPQDMALLLRNHRRVCDHSFCKRCANRLLHSSVPAFRRCAQCRRQFNGLLMIDTFDADLMFRVFDRRNLGSVSFDDYQRAINALGLVGGSCSLGRRNQRRVKQKIDDLFYQFATSATDVTDTDTCDIYGNGGERNGAKESERRRWRVLSREGFRELWKRLLADFDYWLCKQSTITDRELMSISGAPTHQTMSFADYDFNDDADFHNDDLAGLHCSSLCFDCYAACVRSPCGKCCCVHLPFACTCLTSMAHTVASDYSSCLYFLDTSLCWASIVCCSCFTLNYCLHSMTSRIDG